VFATYRLEQTATDHIARTLSAWSVTSSATIAALTACWGLVASVTGPRAAVAIAGVLILSTPLFLPHRPREDVTFVRSASVGAESCAVVARVLPHRRNPVTQDDTDRHLPAEPD
jgi:hypothetical protein